MRFLSLIATTLLAVSLSYARSPDLDGKTTNLGKGLQTWVDEAANPKHGKYLRDIFMVTDAKMLAAYMSKIKTSYPEDLLIYDLRESKYYEKRHITGAISYPIEDKEEKLNIAFADIHKDPGTKPSEVWDEDVKLKPKTVVFYCDKGDLRSPAIAFEVAMQVAMWKASDKGFSIQKVAVLEKGFNKFEKKIKDKAFFKKGLNPKRRRSVRTTRRSIL